MNKAQIITKYGHLLTNTGGNDPQELLSRLENEPRLMTTNSFVFLMAAAVDAQLDLLTRLVNEGLLPGVESDAPTVIVQGPGGIPAYAHPVPVSADGFKFRKVLGPRTRASTLRRMAVSEEVLRLQGSARIERHPDQK